MVKWGYVLIIRRLHLFPQLPLFSSKEVLVFGCRFFESFNLNPNEPFIIKSLLRTNGRRIDRGISNTLWYIAPAVGGGRP